MKISREQVAENRRRILDAASRLFRARGYEAVSVAEVMQAAGLTHGGFYGHFESKDDLIAQTLAHVLCSDDAEQREIGAYGARYLSPAHRDDVAGGCPVAALAVETARQSPPARAAMTAALKRQIARFSEGGTDPEAARRTAIGSWAAMVGAVVLARLADDASLSDEILTQTQEWIRIARQADEAPGPQSGAA